MDIIEVSELAKRYFENIDILQKNDYKNVLPPFKKTKMTFKTTDLEQSVATDFLNACGLTNGEIICKTIKLTDDDIANLHKAEMDNFEKCLQVVNNKLNTNYTIDNFPFIPNEDDINSLIRLYRKRLISNDYTKSKYKLEYSITMFHNTKPLHFGSYSIHLTDNGNPIDDTYAITQTNSNFMERMADFSVPHEERLNMTRVIKLFNDFVYFALQMMNCTNVTIAVPKQYHHSHKKSHKKNSHHTVTITPFQSKKRYTGETIHTGTKLALHKRRGHFKDYSKGKGLFGKLKGIYWFEELVAGSLNEGLSTKDYKVSL